MVTVRVIKSGIYEGRALAAGDTITVPPVTAAVLHRHGFVSLTKVVSAATVIEQPPVEPPRRRRYRRRDLEAEP